MFSLAKRGKNDSYAELLERPDLMYEAEDKVGKPMKNFEVCQESSFTEKMHISGGI